jgi:hypothetical protein
MGMSGTARLSLRGVLTGSRQPSIGCNHDLFLAQKIEVSADVVGMVIDDGGEVT